MPPSSIISSSTMQLAGDCTGEGSTRSHAAFGSASNGLQRWFPQGHQTCGVDWRALEDHLSQVPDLAFESSTKMPSALHLAVACHSPPAPRSTIQRLLHVHPDALYQTDAQSGNVLHCALKHNPHLRPEVLDLLLQAKPDLATQVCGKDEVPPLAFCSSASHVPALVRVMPTKLVCKLLQTIFVRRTLLGGSVEAMEQVVMEVSKLEQQQGRSILALNIVPERRKHKLSLIEYALQQFLLRGKQTQERADLWRLTNKLIQATYLLQFPPSDGKRDLEEDDETMGSPHDSTNRNAFASCPQPLECLKTLVTQQKLKQKALELYQSILTTMIASTTHSAKSSMSYLENVECLLEPTHGNHDHDLDASDHGAGPMEDATAHTSNTIDDEPSHQSHDHASDHGLVEDHANEFITISSSENSFPQTHNGEPSGQEEVARFPRRVSHVHDPSSLLWPIDEEQQDAFYDNNHGTTDPYVTKLVKCKQELDAKLDKSFDILRQTALALEGYRESYTNTVDKLCQEAKIMSQRQAGASRQPAFGDGADESMASIRAIVALSNTTNTNSKSMPPVQPKRQESGDFDDEVTGAQVLALDETVVDAMESMKAAMVVLERYNNNLSAQSRSLVKEHEDQACLNMEFFRSPEHDQAQDAMARISEYQSEKESLIQAVDMINQQLEGNHEMKATGNTSTSTASSETVNEELNLSWVRATTELRDVSRKIETLQELLTSRRQELGQAIMKARRIVRDRTISKNTRQKANRFLKQAKQEMRSILEKVLIGGGSNSKRSGASRRQKKKLRQQQRQQRQRQRGKDGEEEEEHRESLEEEEQHEPNLALQALMEEDLELSRMAKRMKIAC